jgi:hypothetical protein
VLLNTCAFLGDHKKGSLKNDKKKFNISKKVVIKNHNIQGICTLLLLMHAMAPNVVGIIGSAVAAGMFLAAF